MYECKLVTKPPVNPAPACEDALAATPKTPVGDALIRCGAVLSDCQRQAQAIIQALDGSHGEYPSSEPETIMERAYDNAIAAEVVLRMLERINELLGL